MAAAADDPVIELTKQDLENLLSQHFGMDMIVKNFTTEPLTAPGDNYGSTILAVEVIYQNGQDQTLNKLPVVAKLVPPTAYFRASFNIYITFKKEVRAYTLVCPEFISLQKEIGLSDDEILDVFPKFYGARTNRQGDVNEKADDTAVLLLENLKTSGYRLGNRRIGCNLSHVELVVKSLAVFHALGVALKFKKPEVFKETILKTCEKFTLGNLTSDEENKKWIINHLGYVKLIPECEPYLEKIESKFCLQMEMYKNLASPSSNGPFATFVHNDFWLNNVMFKYENADNNGNEISGCEIPTGVKFVDFQISIYDSAVRDLIFFLFTSSEDGIIDNHLDELLILYHKEFIDALRKLDCDISPFTFRRFKKELDEFAPEEFTHILILLKVVSADGKAMTDLSEMDIDEMFVNTGGEVYANKVRSFILGFEKRGWL